MRSSVVAWTDSTQMRWNSHSRRHQRVTKLESRLCASPPPARQESWWAKCAYAVAAVRATDSGGLTASVEPCSDRCTIDSATLQETRPGEATLRKGGTPLCHQQDQAQIWSSSPEETRIPPCARPYKTRRGRFARGLHVKMSRSSQDQGSNRPERNQPAGAYSVTARSRSGCTQPPRDALTGPPSGRGSNR